MPGDTLLFFASLCLFLSSIEYAVPKPLPFMRLGLANLPVIFAVKSFPAHGIFLLVLLKILLSSFISGTTFSYVFLFSAAGSLASAAAVLLLHSLLGRCGLSRHISNVGLCLAGALANNAAQIAVARALIFGRQAYVIAPLLLASGLVSAIALGLFANKFEENSRFLKAVREGVRRADSTDGAEGGGDATERRAGPAQIIPAVIALPLMLLLPFLPTICEQISRQPARPPLPALHIQAAAWLVLLAADAFARKGRIRLLSSFILIVSLTALSLLSPSGKVLHTVGGFRITQGALEAGLSKALVLTGMLFASQTIFAALRGRGLGRSGRLGRIFADFARLSERRLAIKEGGLMAALDKQLCELWGDRPVAVSKGEEK